jgi:hypothetical protein
MGQVLLVRYGNFAFLNVIDRLPGEGTLRYVPIQKIAANSGGRKNGPNGKTFGPVQQGGKKFT